MTLKPEIITGIQIMLQADPALQVQLKSCTDMTEETLQECLKRVDMNVFMENPSQALIDAGVNLKKGATLKFVETEAEAIALPANVFPLMRLNKNIEALSMEDLDKVAGGQIDYQIGDGGYLGSWQVVPNGPRRGQTVWVKKFPPEKG
ncbi:hypothetical protein [Polaromonas sp. YR568]|uniref:hypothetical protein n=1 Tax=Polaromonas sp. YR568 TaxID=1855301 RepID=UPI003137BFAD